MVTSTAVVASDPPAQTGKRTLLEEASGAKSAKRSRVLDRESSNVLTQKIIKDNFPGWAVEATDVRKHPTTGFILREIIKTLVRRWRAKDPTAPKRGAGVYNELRAALRGGSDPMSLLTPDDDQEVIDPVLIKAWAMAKKNKPERTFFMQFF